MYEEGSERENRDHISMFDENSLQCPFTWSPRTDATSKELIFKFEHKIVDVENEEGETVLWSKFILNLILCYEYSNLGQSDRANKKEKKCENIIDDPQAINNYILSEKRAFKHVLLSSKFFLLEKNLLKEESADILRDIVLVSKMNNKEKATVWSIGSAVLMEYDSRSKEKSVRFVKKALDIDPDCAEWHFLLSKVLRRIRCDEMSTQSIPEDDEIEALQSAVDKSKDPFYKVMLAETYLCMARTMYFNRVYTDMNILNKSSLLYRQALEDGGNNPFVLRKCSEGYNKLPRPFKNLQLSKECIFRALEIAPYAGIVHTAGIILQEENSELAKQYLTRAIEGGYFPSCYHLLKIKHKENISFDPCADIERYWSLFTSDHEKRNFFAWLGAYHYYVKDNFDAALEYWRKLFDVTTASHVLTKFYSPWNIRTTSFNISEIIKKEINERKRDPRYDANQQAQYQSILQELERHV